MQRELCTKERIFSAAFDLASKYGFSHVSVRMIASEAGIRESSVYNHFSRKDEIFTHMLTHILELDRKSAYSRRKIDRLLKSSDTRGVL